MGQAVASGRTCMGINELVTDSIAWIPKMDRMPETEEEVEFFEKWYPLEVELPDGLKTLDWYWNKKDPEIYGQYKCVHGENRNNCYKCSTEQ